MSKEVITQYNMGIKRSKAFNYFFNKYFWVNKFRQMTLWVIIDVNENDLAWALNFDSEINMT